MTDPLTRREKWIKELAVLVAPQDADAAADALMPMLDYLTGFPDAAFTRRSCEHVAAGSRAIPNYAALSAKLGEWWRENSREMALPPPAAKSPSEEQAEQRALLAAEWADASVVERAIGTLRADGWRDAMVRLLRLSLSRHAPQHLDTLRAVYETETGRELGNLLDLEAG